MDAGTIIAAIALVISGVSLYYSKLQPGKLVGNLSYVVLWRFSSNKDGQLTDLKITPALWLANIGVRPVLISDIRLRLQPEGEKAFNAYPTNTVPSDAINAPGEFSDYGRLSLGGPFQGIRLGPEQRWGCHFNFFVPQQFLPRLVGAVAVSVEVKCGAGKSWRVALTDFLEFGSKPFHKNPLHSGVGVEGIHVYSRVWKERTRESVK